MKTLPNLNYFTKLDKLSERANFTCAHVLENCETIFVGGGGRQGTDEENLCKRSRSMCACYVENERAQYVCNCLLSQNDSSHEVEADLKDLL
jgi:hypothetical protein